MLLRRISNGHHIYAEKTPRPRFSSHRGRTWDFEEVVVNQVRLKVFFDTTWGFYAYFEWDGQWYKVVLDKLDPYNPTAPSAYYTFEIIPRMRLETRANRP